MKGSFGCENNHDADSPHSKPRGSYMSILTDNDIAFILIETAALFMLLGIFWYTTPYRKLGRVGDKLFLCLEVCGLLGAISDIMYFVAHFIITSSGHITTMAKVFAQLSIIFAIGDTFFNTFLLLYTCYLLTGNERLLRIIKVPLLLLPTIRAILTIVYRFLPHDITDIRIGRFTITGALYYACLATIVVMIFFVSRKLMVYYLIVLISWLLLSKIVPMLEFTAIVHAQLLVFTHILVVNKELEAREKKAESRLNAS